MTLGTTAQPWAWDAGAWKKGDGTNKGMWVRDGGSWKVVKELYAHDGSSWNIVSPITITACINLPPSNGTCGAVDATYRIRSTIFGPVPQGTGTEDRYQIKHYERFSSVSSIDLLSKPWVLVENFNITQTLMLGPSHSYGYVISFGTTDWWHQLQGRIVHTVHGELAAASGGIRSSTIRQIHVDPCGNGNGD